MYRQILTLTVSTCMREQSFPDWTPPSQSVEQVFSPTTRGLPKNIGGRHAIGAPIHIYPLYENGFRAYRGQSIADNHHESPKLYAQFSEVASRNPYAWGYPHQDSEETIGTVSKRNRMICFPCMPCFCLCCRLDSSANADDRPPAHERVQHGQSRCCLYSYIYRLCQGTGHSPGKMDISP